MSWLLKLVLQRLFLNKKRNILLIIQIFLGAAILFACLSVEECCHKQSAIYGEGISSQIITINANRTTEDEKLELEDYEYIKDSLLPEEYTAVYSINTSIYMEYNGTELYVPVLFVSDDYMKTIVGLEEQDTNGYYLGEKISKIIYSDQFAVTYGMNVYDSSKRKLYDWPVEKFNVLHVKSTAQMAQNAYISTYTGFDMSFSNSIFIPLHVYNQYKENIRGEPGLYIIPRRYNDPSVDEVCNKICKELTLRHPSIWFTYSNDLEEVRKYQTDLLRNSALFKTVSIIMIIILFLELIGQFMLIAFRRQRSFAIARMCGAEAERLIWELFIEIALQSSVGALIGIAVAAFVIPTFSTRLYRVGGTMGAATVVFGLFLFISAVTVIFCIPTIVRSTPISILRNHDE